MDPEALNALVAELQGGGRRLSQKAAGGVSDPLLRRDSSSSSIGEAATWPEGPGSSRSSSSSASSKRPRAAAHGGSPTGGVLSCSPRRTISQSPTDEHEFAPRLLSRRASGDATHGPPPVMSVSRPTGPATEEILPEFQNVRFCDEDQPDGSVMNESTAPNYGALPVPADSSDTSRLYEATGVSVGSGGSADVGVAAAGVGLCFGSGGTADVGVAAAEVHTASQISEVVKNLWRTLPPSNSFQEQSDHPSYATCTDENPEHFHTVEEHPDQFHAGVDTLNPVIARRSSEDRMAAKVRRRNLAVSTLRSDMIPRRSSGGSCTDDDLRRRYAACREEARHDPRNKELWARYVEAYQDVRTQSAWMGTPTERRRSVSFIREPSAATEMPAVGLGGGTVKLSDDDDEARGLTLHIYFAGHEARVMIVTIASWVCVWALFLAEFQRRTYQAEKEGGGSKGARTDLHALIIVVVIPAVIFIGVFVHWRVSNVTVTTPGIVKFLSVIIIAMCSAEHRVFFDNQSAFFKPVIYKDRSR